MPTDAEVQFTMLNHFINDWDHAPANPRQWSPVKKWQAMAIVSFYTFIATLGSSMMAPALPDIAKKYDITNSAIVAMTLSIFFLSFALGPLFDGPLSEMYGRKWILHISNLAHVGFNLGCAFSPTSGSLIAFRFLSGWAAAAPTAVGGATINDLFVDRERAVAMAVYIAGPLIGFVIGPIAGGFIAQTIGVKYVFITMSALCSLAALIGIPFLRETYAPVIRLRLAKMSSEPEKVAEAHLPMNKPIWHILWLNLSRPVILLSHSFICFILSLYLAMIYGINILMFATFPSLFSEVYHFSSGIDGLAFIGPGVGYMMATVFGGQISTKIYSTLADKNGGNGKPEMRIPSLIFGSFFIPIGLFWYGWSAETRIHWIMPMIGAGIFGFGYVNVVLSVYLYLVDAFAFTASAVSAAAVFQSLLGFVFPLFGQDMYVKLGYGGGNSLLAGLAIVIGIPFPIWIWYKGEDIRKRSAAFLAPNLRLSSPAPS
jgi:MFS family permease